MDVENHVRLAKYSPGRIEFEPTPEAPSDLGERLGSRLKLLTGVRWAITIVSKGGAPTIKAKRAAEEENLKNEAKAHPLVQAIFDAFPKAAISKVKTPKSIANEAQGAALPEVKDEWDPFEDN